MNSILAALIDWAEPPAPAARRVTPRINATPSERLIASPAPTLASNAIPYSFDSQGKLAVMTVFDGGVPPLPHGETFGVIFEIRNPQTLSSPVTRCILIDKMRDCSQALAS